MTAGDRAGAEAGALYRKMKAEAEAGGYFLNPDEAFAKELITGLAANQDRYGQGVCPCRLATGDEEADRDIECPCDYRDADLDEHGQCYCGLYVSEEVISGRKDIGSIPERRRPDNKRERAGSPAPSVANLSHPVWRCSVCGYLCARDKAPLVCPICKAKKERFERFI